MAIVFRRGLVLPIWAIVLSMIALTGTRLMLSLIVLAGVATIGLTIRAAVRWLCDSSRRRGRTTREWPRIQSSRCTNIIARAASIINHHTS